MDSQPKTTADAFCDIKVTIEAQFEDQMMDVHEVLAIQPGAFVPLGRTVGEAVRVYVGNVFLATAEVIVIDEHLALRITAFERLD